MTRFKLDRRLFLRGLTATGAAVTIGLPGLDAMFNENGTALAAGGDIPKRFGIWFWGNSVHHNQWIPPETGDGFALSEALMPLSDLRDHFSIVSGMDVHADGGSGGHHGGTTAILSGAMPFYTDPERHGSTFSAPSIDQVVAEHIGSETRFRSLEIGISNDVVTSEDTTLQYLSHNGVHSANPPEYSPTGFFNRIFGDGFRAPDAEPVFDPRVALRRSVLDTITEDANALIRRLGVVDRRRLDRHLTGIRTIERRIAMFESMPMARGLAACARPDDPSAGAGPDPRDSYDGDPQLIPRNQLMSELLAMALACDQTRVFSTMYSGSVGGTRYPGTPQGHHGLGHDEGGDQPMIRGINIYIMQRFAEFMQAFQDIEEGDGTLLDHCAILTTSDLGDPKQHTVQDFPILVAGGGGGALRTGHHYRSDGENTTNVLLSLLHAMDIDVDGYGVDDGRSTTPCTQILTGA